MSKKSGAAKRKAREQKIVASYEYEMSRTDNETLRWIVSFEDEFSKKAAKIELEYRQELEDFLNDHPMDIIGESLRRNW